MWVLTSDPPKHVSGRLLSHLHYQETAVSRRDFTSYRCARASHGSAKPSKLAPHVGVRLCRAGFDIRPIVTQHETPAEPSCLSGDDADESWSLLPVRESVPGGRRESVWKASKSVPHVGIGLYRAGFDIISIDIHHETPAEPSTSPGDDDDASRSLRPVRESIPQWRARKRRSRHRTWVSGYTVRIFTSDPS